MIDPDKYQELLDAAHERFRKHQRETDAAWCEHLHTVIQEEKQDDHQLRHNAV